MRNLSRTGSRGLWAMTVVAFSGLALAAATPFVPSAVLSRVDTHALDLTIRVTVPPGHYLYADQFSVTTQPALVQSTVSITPSEKHNDPFTGETKEIFNRDVTAVYRVAGVVSNTLTVTVSYQGCNEKICFLPQSDTLVVTAGPAVPSAPAVEHVVATTMSDIPDALRNFRIAGARSGYLSADEFSAFLASTGQDRGAAGGFAQQLWSKGLIWAALLVILLGGLALNLTPCVLPMIPINLAIIGAGAQAGSRSRGFLLGAWYASGIAVAYGMLGLVVVLSGTAFGSLNASPWFNLGIAVLFVVLALGMFDVLMIDLSRFQGRWADGTGGVAAIFLMGAVSALLAGACVAPVVISVLLLSADLYAKGQVAGLLLPFLLGVGMALPWPFAGAGLSFLPKPGRWMERVKYVFGVFILIMAAYYGYTGVTLLRTDPTPAMASTVAAGMEDGGWLTSLPQALAEAQREQKPVLIDFWAGWCKNCHAMDATTFKNDKVQKDWQRYVRVKYRAEQPNQSPAKEVLHEFGVLGLPTYVILVPR